MREPRRTSEGLTALGVAVLLLLGSGGAYLAGYLVLSEFSYWSFATEGFVTFDGGVRTFDHAWQAYLYAPAARVEGWITGEEVCTGYKNSASQDFADMGVPTLVK